MSDAYGVTTEAIDAEMPQLFPDGFSPSTKPSDDVVKDFILTADTMVGLKMQALTGLPPDRSAEAAKLARRYIILWAKAQTLRVVYMRDPNAANMAAGPYEKMAADLLASLTDMRETLVDTGTPVSQVRGGTSDRDMLVTDEMLGAGARGGSPNRPF